MTVHIGQLVPVVPICSGCMCDRLIVATSFLQKEADVLLSNDANVEYYRCLEKVCDNVNVEKKIVF